MVRVAEKARTVQRASAVGLTLVMGAGLGLIIALLVWDGAGIAIGMAVGAALGVVVGAVGTGCAPRAESWRRLVHCPGNG